MRLNISLRLLFSLALLIGVPCAAQMTLTGAGGTKSVAAAPFALDGTPQFANSGGSSAFALPAYTSTYGSDVVLILIEANGGPVTSVTGGGLTFAREPGLTPPTSGGGSTFDVWYAVSSSPLSSTVFIVNTTSSAYLTAGVLAVSGAHTAAPFDASSPTTTSSSCCALLTTTSANTFAVAFTNSTGNGTGSGWTNMYALNFMTANYQLFTSTQASNNPYSIAGGSVSIAAAVIKGP